MKVNGADEVLLVAVASGRCLHPLDLPVQCFAAGVGDPVPAVVQNRKRKEGQARLSLNAKSLAQNKLP